LAREILTKKKKARNAVGLLSKEKAIISQYEQSRIDKQLKLAPRSTLTSSGMVNIAKNWGD